MFLRIYQWVFIAKNYLRKVNIVAESDCEMIGAKLVMQLSAYWADCPVVPEVRADCQS